MTALSATHLGVQYLFDDQLEELLRHPPLIHSLLAHELNLQESFIQVGSDQGRQDDRQAGRQAGG